MRACHQSHMWEGQQASHTHTDTQTPFYTCSALLGTPYHLSTIQVDIGLMRFWPSAKPKPRRTSYAAQLLAARRGRFAASGGLATSGGHAVCGPGTERRGMDGRLGLGGEVEALFEVSTWGMFVCCWIIYSLWLSPYFVLCWETRVCCRQCCHAKA